MSTRLANLFGEVMERVNDLVSPLAVALHKCRRVIGQRVGSFLDRLDGVVDAVDGGVLFERTLIMSTLVFSVWVLAVEAAIWADTGSWPHRSLGTALTDLGVDLTGLGHSLPDWKVIRDGIAEVARIPLWQIALIPPACIVFSHARGWGIFPNILSIVISLTVPVGLVVLAAQGYVWVTTGAWPEVPMAAALPYVGIGSPTINEPTSWKGLASV